MAILRDAVSKIIFYMPDVDSRPYNYFQLLPPSGLYSYCTLIVDTVHMGGHTAVVQVPYTPLDKFIFVIIAHIPAFKDRSPFSFSLICGLTRYKVYIDLQV